MLIINVQWFNKYWTLNHLLSTAVGTGDVAPLGQRLPSDSRGPSLHPHTTLTVLTSPFKVTAGKVHDWLTAQGSSVEPGPVIPRISAPVRLIRRTHSNPTCTLLKENAWKTQKVKRLGQLQTQRDLDICSEELQDHFEGHSKTSAKQRQGKSPPKLAHSASVLSKFMASYDLVWKRPAVKH